MTAYDYKTQTEETGNRKARAVRIDKLHERMHFLSSSGGESYARFLDVDRELDVLSVSRELTTLLNNP